MHIYRLKLSTQEVAKDKEGINMKVRKVSISLKMAVIVALLLIVTDCTLGFIVYRDQSNSMIDQI